MTTALAQCVTISDCRYGRMLHLANDQYIGRSLATYGEFSEGEVDLFRQYVHAGDIVFDVGANIGAHTVALATLVGARGAVLAFEPIRFLYHLLAGNVALNGLLQVRAYQHAVGSEPGTVRVPPIDFTQVDNYGGLELGNWAYGERVDVIRLDDVMVPRCDFLKIDVEGMEQAVLQGAKGLIARFKPILYVENNPGPRSEPLVETIRGLGYELYHHAPPLFNAANLRGIAEDIFSSDGVPVVSHNVVCLPPGRATPHGLRVLTGGHPVAGAVGPDHPLAPAISDGG